jgi:hypothetical protein
MVELAVGVDTDEGTLAPLAHVDDRLVGDVIHEAYAPRAQDAAVRHVEDVAPEVLHRVEPLSVGRRVPSASLPLLEHVVLELTLAGLIADGAVQRVVDQ